MMLINNKFKRGDIVYLVTDPEQKRRIVRYITVFDENDIQYSLACGTEFSENYDFEISKEPDQNIKLGIEESNENT